MNYGVTRQDAKLFEAPSKAMLIFRLLIDLAILAVFTIVLFQAVLLSLGWYLGLVGAAGIFLSTLLAHGELVHYRVETILRRRIVHYANRAMYAEADNTRLRRNIDQAARTERRAS